MKLGGLVRSKIIAELEGIRYSNRESLYDKLMDNIDLEVYHIIVIDIWRKVEFLNDETITTNGIR